MKQEEKDLLLKDLCTRIPYGVKGKVYAEVTDGEYDMEGEMIFYDAPFDVILDGINISTEEIHVVAIGNEDTVDFIEMQQADGTPYTIDDFKPYLRPMSSITEEEKYKLLKFGAITCLENGEVIDVSCVGFERHADIQDYLNACHLDYRGLISKGLALEAKEGMYKNK